MVVGKGAGLVRKGADGGEGKTSLLVKRSVGGKDKG